MDFKLWLLETNKPTVVIIKGNPARLVGGDLYDKLESYFRSRGYSVLFDEGEPYSVPLVADIWVGHSRGADRLKYAPEGVLKISIGSSRLGSVNHPEDIVDIRPDEWDNLPERVKLAHNSWHSSFEGLLDNLIN